MVLTVYADRRSVDVTAVAEGLAAALRSQSGTHQVITLFDRPGEGEKPRRKRASTKVTPAGALAQNTLPANPVPALANAASAPDITILGVWGPLTGELIAAFDLSRVVLLVTDASVASLRAAQRTLKLCGSLGFGSDRVLVVSMLDEDSAHFELSVVATALKRDIIGRVPRPGATSAEAAYNVLCTRVLHEAAKRAL